jgi:hypothetical protein
MAYEDSLHGVLQGLLLLALLWATWGGTVASERTASSWSGKVERSAVTELQESLKAINPECRRRRSEPEWRTSRAVIARCNSAPLSTRKA